MTRSGLPAAVAFAAGLLMGCAGGHTTPMATDGPNQVVLKVPNMT
jgi:hypothetical protein